MGRAIAQAGVGKVCDRGAQTCHRHIGIITDMITPFTARAHPPSEAITVSRPACQVFRSRGRDPRSWGISLDGI